MIGDDMPNDETKQERRADSEACGDCVIAQSRRAFLRDTGLATAAALAAIALTRPTVAFAESVREMTAPPSALPERSYPIPADDSVSVDVANGVILARWENRLYAFSLKCPHKGARLEWRAGEQRIFCPKHKARFGVEGSHLSGRGSRDLDRYALRREGGGVVVDLGRAYREDNDPVEWADAVVALD